MPAPHQATARPRLALLRLALLCLLPAIPHAGHAQAIKVTSRLPIARPHVMCAICTLTVAVSPAVLNFTLVRNGTAVATPSLSIVTTLSGVASISGTVNLYAYFSSSTAALTGTLNAADVLPSSAVLGRCSTGLPTSFTAFSQTAPFGGTGASLEIFTETVSGLLLPASRTDALALEINLAGVTNVAADTYTGVLFFQAEQF